MVRIIFCAAKLIIYVFHNFRVFYFMFKDGEQMKETNATVQTEMTTSLSENEKLLTQHYKRIIAIGKGSRAVINLIPKNIQNYFTMIQSFRTTTTWFHTTNTYFLPTLAH